MSQLKIVALDVEDLQVVSSQVQDAVLKVADITFLPKEKLLALAMNRFAWDKPSPRGLKRFFKKASLERRRAALSFSRVTSVKSFGLQPEKSDKILSLLALEFTPDDAPSGTITLHFSGGGALAVQVECIECQLADLGAAWATDHLPSHDLDAL